MSRRFTLSFALLVLTGLGFAAAPTVLAGDPCFHDLSRPSTSEGAYQDVGIDECTFLPTVNHVPVGTEVTFINKSSQAHEVVGSNLKWGAHKKMLQPGDTIGWRFDTPGVYAYSCMLHPGMTGAIVVGPNAAAEAASSTEASPAEATSADTPTAGVPTAGVPTAGFALAGAGGLVIGMVAAGLLFRRRDARD
jgi:plastocyanin